MCQIVTVDGEECETVGELLREIGPNIALELSRHYDDFELPDNGHCCLCPIDIRPTLEAAGYTVWENEAGDFHALSDTGLRP